MGKTGLPPDGDFGFGALRLDLVHIGLGPSFAEHGVGLVVRDAVQPGGEAPRVVEFAEVLIGFQENVLRQVQSVFAVGGDAQEVVVDTLLPPGDEEVISLHAAPGSLTNQVGIFDRPKDQILWLLVGRRNAAIKSRMGKLPV